MSLHAHRCIECIFSLYFFQFLTAILRTFSAVLTVSKSSLCGSRLIHQAKIYHQNILDDFFFFTLARHEITSCLTRLLRWGTYIKILVTYSELYLNVISIPLLIHIFTIAISIKWEKSNLYTGLISVELDSLFFFKLEIRLGAKS